MRINKLDFIGTTLHILISFATALIWSAPPANGQTATPRRITLKEAATLVLKNNRTVQMAEIGVARSTAEYKQARSVFRPQVLLGSGLAYSKGFPLSIEGSAPSIFQVNAAQALFDQSLRNIERQAGAVRDSADNSLADQRDLALLQAVLVYLDLDRSRRSLEHVREQARGAETTASLIDERVGAGLDTPLEAAKGRLAAARARNSVKTLENSIALLEFSLRDLTGIPQSDSIETVAPDLNLLAHVSEVAAFSELALARSPALAALDDDVRSREFAVRSEQASRWPRVNLVGQYALFSKHNNYEDYFKRFERNNLTIGASIVIPLYDRASFNARMSKAGAELRAAQNRRDTARAGIAQQVRVLTATISQQQDAREVAQLELEVARKTLDSILAQYEEGRVNRLVVEQARIDENRAWVNLFDVEYQAERSKIELLKLTGELRATLL
ncbi:MAG: TolC family protein [Acidobacteria bacterium]|nr:TolC family protein [Acidobacteriota bacterium]